VANCGIRVKLPLWLGYRLQPSFDPDLGPVPIPNDGIDIVAIPAQVWNYGRHLGGRENSVLAFGAIFGGALFGALHCLAWNSHFPTDIERVAWRVCSVLITALPVAAMVPMALWVRINKWVRVPKWDWKAKTVGLILTLGFIFPYVTLRMFLMVEMFRAMFFLPPKAFVNTSWSSLVPHFG